MTLARAALIYSVAVTACLLFLPYPYHDDDITHYLIARDAFEIPAFFLDIWGRPGFTILHAAPAQLGFIGCRAFSALLTLFAGLACAAACRRFGARIAMLAFTFLVFQPYAFHLADGALTETVFALSLALAILAFERGRLAWGALAMSWGAISRLEGMPLLLVAAAWIVVETRRTSRSWLSAAARVALLGTFPVLWNVGCSARTGFTRPLALLTDNLFINAENAAYGSGSWARYVGYSWEIHGPVIAVLAVVGGIAMVRRGAWFAPAYLVVFYAMQSVLWAGGLFRTGGYHRFFASIAPAAAVAAAWGVCAWDRRREERAKRPIAAAWLIVGVIAWGVGHVATYHTLSDPNYRAVARALDTARAAGSPSPSRPLVTNTPYPKLLLDGDPAAEFIRDGDSRSIREATVGTFMLLTAWATAPSPADGDVVRDAHRSQPESFTPFFVRLFERVAVPTR